MGSVDVFIDISASPEVVWADISNLGSHAEWMADVVRIEFDGALRTGVGATMRVLTRVGPLRTVDVIRVIGWEPPHLMEVVHEGVVTGSGVFRLESSGDGTRFRWSEQLGMPWYFGGALGAYLAAPILARIWRGNLRRLAARFDH